MNHNELKHFGVLGMKWGVRRNRSSSKGSIGSRVKKTFDKWDKQEAAYQKQKLGKATTGRAYLEAMQFTAATTAALGVAGTVAGYYLNK